MAWVCCSPPKIRWMWTTRRSPTPGTWFIGKLQTDQDKQRLLDGLDGRLRGHSRARARPPDLRARQTCLRPAQRARRKAGVFQTRWTMNFLAGPLTRVQIPALESAGGGKASVRPQAPISPGACRSPHHRQLPQLFLLAPPSGCRPAACRRAGAAAAVLGRRQRQLRRSLPCHPILPNTSCLRRTACRRPLPLRANPCPARPSFVTWSTVLPCSAPPRSISLIVAVGVDTTITRAAHPAQSRRAVARCAGRTSPAIPVRLRTSNPTPTPGALFGAIDPPLNEFKAHDRAAQGFHGLGLSHFDGQGARQPGPQGLCRPRCQPGRFHEGLRRRCP